MKITLHLIVGLLLFGTNHFNLQAQTRCFQGTVRNEVGQGLGNAMVLLADSTSLGGNEYAAVTETDSIGHYQAETSMPVNRIIVNKLGYAPAMVAVTSGKDCYDVTLAGSADMVLDEVTVRGYKQAVKMKPNGLEFDMKYSPIRDGSTWDALRFVPNVKIAEGGRVSIIGMNDIAIYLDGRKLKLEGEAAMAYIQSFPVERIQTVEVLTAPDGRFAESPTTGIIHIITKHNENEGFRGKVAAQGWKTHYLKGNGDFMLAYNKGKFSAEFFAAAQHNSTWNTAQQETDYLANGNQSTGNDTYDARNTNLNLQAQVSYRLTDYSTISGLAGFTYGKSDTEQYGNTRFFSPKRKEAEIANNIQNRKDSKRAIANMEYRNSFGKQGTQLQVTADYYYGNVQATLESRMDSIKEGKPNVPHNYYNEIMPQKAHLWSGLARYTTPLGQRVSFTAGLNGDYTLIDNDDRYQKFHNGNFVHDPLRSNFLEMKEWSLEAALFFNIRLSNRWNTYFGMSNRYRKYHSEQKHTREAYSKGYWQPTPILSVSYNGNNHAVSYSGAYYKTSPNFGHMNPFRWYSSATTYLVGNPNLSQAKKMYHRLNYNFLQHFQIGAYYNYADDLIEYYSRVVENGMIEQRPENLTKQQNFSLTLNANNLEYCKGKGYLSISGTLWRQWYHSEPPQGSAINHVEDGFSLNLQHFARLSDKHRIQLINDISYNSASHTAFNENPANFNFYVEMQKMHKAWTFSLYGFVNGFMYDGVKIDMKWRKSYYNDQLVTRSVQKGEGYSIGIRINYAFGNSKVKNLRKSTSPASNVRSRLE